MSDLIALLEKLPDRPWVDILVLTGLGGGLVFAIWIVGGALKDLATILLLRPNARLGRHVKRKGK